MTLKQTKPFTPVVTQQQIRDYNPDKPETQTPSKLVNAVLDAFQVVHPLSARDVGRYLQLAPSKLSHALEVLTGLNFTQLRNLWTQQRLEWIKTEHPDWGADEVARSIGYADRSAMWRMNHRSVSQQAYADYKRQYAQYLSMTPEERQADRARKMDIMLKEKERALQVRSQRAQRDKRTKE